MGRLQKLRRMPLKEARHRASEQWIRLAEWAEYSGLSRARHKDLAGLPSTLGVRALELVPGFRPANIADLRKRFPNLHEEIAARSARRAGRLLEGKWQLLGREVDLSGRLASHADPVTERVWPKHFYARIQVYDLPDELDVKYVWELNRHQYLVELARNWVFAHESSAASRARDVILDWIDQNPLYEGVNWASALEVAVRSTSWLWTLAGLADWPEWSLPELERISNSLIDHAGYLHQHLSIYSSPYNHLVGEATALYLLSRLLRDYRDATLWGKKARAVLEQHGPTQFHADGFCVEQASSYHFFTLGFLAMACLAARAGGMPFTQLERTAAQAFTAGAAFKPPDNRWSAIGDLDSARSIPVIPDDWWDFRSFCALGAAMFDLAALKSLSTDAGEEAYWLLGTEGIDRWNNIEAAPARAGTVLPSSGYAIAGANQNASDWVLFDAGPIADGLHADAVPSVAHGHLDALQLILYQAGNPILIDSGIPSYAASPEWVEYFRGAGAHNTIEVEGVPLARTAGRLAWSHVNGKTRLDANLTEETSLLHGRLDMRSAVIDRHVLRLAGRGVWVADHVRTSHPRVIRWFWHLHHRTHPATPRFDGHVHVIALKSGVLAVWPAVAGFEMNVEASSSDNPVAWVSDAYGCLQHGYRVCCTVTQSIDCWLLTFIGKASSSAVVAAQGEVVHGVADLTELREVLQEVAGADLVWCIRESDGWDSVRRRRRCACDHPRLGADSWRRQLDRGQAPASYKFRGPMSLSASGRMHPSGTASTLSPRRILVLSSTFPSNIQPIHGVFVKERIRSIASMPGYSFLVISPVPYFPPIPAFKKWYPYSQIPRREVIDGLPVIRPRYFLPPKIGGFLHGDLMVASLWRTVERASRDFAFDLIDAHFAYPDGVAAAQLARRFRRPLVITCRGEDILTLPKIPVVRGKICRALQSATKVIAVSGEIACALKDLGVESRKIEVIPNGVDTERFQPLGSEEMRRRLGLPSDRRIVLSVGYQLERKGFHILIDAVPAIRDRFQDVLVVIVGGPARWGQDYSAEIERRVQDQRLEDHVRLVGARPPEELPEWYSASDLFVLLSSREGCPNVLLEALSCGLPAVATAVGEIPEILRDRRLGIVIPKRSADVAARSIVEALSTQWNREEIRRLMEPHSWRRTATEVERVFGDVLSEHRGPGSSSPASL